MPSIYFFSGPCGCGKTTLANGFAKHLVNNTGKPQVYVIHGDDFHNGFIEKDNKDESYQNASSLEWPEILEFNWQCIVDTANKAITKGLDVIIDYVVEDELPLMIALAQKHNVKLYYIVLTANESSIRERITKREDVDMIERALFLKDKLESLPENSGHIFDNTGLSLSEELSILNIEDYEVNI